MTAAQVYAANLQGKRRTTRNARQIGFVVYPMGVIPAMPPSVRDESPQRAVPSLLGLGASLGDRLENLRAALKRLEERGLRVQAVSPVYESPHLGLNRGDEDRYPAHLNIAAEVETYLSPEALLDLVQSVEAEGGRQRLERWGPRTIDIDILDYGGQQIQSDRLTLPHPGIAKRAFVAVPLLDIRPDFQLPDGSHLRDQLTSGTLCAQVIKRIDTPISKYKTT